MQWHTQIYTNYIIHSICKATMMYDMLKNFIPAGIQAVSTWKQLDSASKATPIWAWRGPSGCRRLRRPWRLRLSALHAVALTPPPGVISLIGAMLAPGPVVQPEWLRQCKTSITPLEKKLEQKSTDHKMHSINIQNTKIFVKESHSSAINITYKDT
jgi:hypothetical protein